MILKNFYKYSLYLLLTLSVVNIANTPKAYADLDQLVECKSSPQFQKRLDNTVKKLEFRLKKYDENTQAAQNIKNQINNTKARFLKYQNENLLCGKDGLPHLVTDGRLTHAKEFVLPGLLFIYITGWIGWVGRKYIQYAAITSNPNESEIILDVPYALKSMTTGFIWPIEAWTELVNGELLADDDEITVSPR